jgi:phage tail-like protein
MAGNSLRIDPLGAFNFYVTLIDSSNLAGTLLTAVLSYAVAGFSECSGLDASMEIMEYREGGVNGYVHKFATRASHTNLVLKQGVIYLYDTLWDWHYNWVQGTGTRKDGLVVLLDESRQPAKIWKFKRGIPMKWVGPPLNAAQSNVAIESLDIAHEGLELELGG